MTYLTDDEGSITKAYEYDAFGNEENPVATDTNPFRYAGEYYDKETGTYYLRARYYDPVIGRFTQEDPHWNQSNMLYGDDPLKLNNYNYAPSLAAIIQSGNLYVYAMSNPTRYTDPGGEFAITTLLASKAGDFVISTIVDGLATGLAYRANGKSFVKGLISGSISGATTNFFNTIFDVGAIGDIAISTVVSVANTLITNGKMGRQDFVEAFVEGIVSGVSSVYFKEIHEFTKNNDLLLELSSAYTELTGYEVKYFFQGIVTATMEMEH